MNSGSGLVRAFWISFARCLTRSSHPSLQWTKLAYSDAGDLDHGQDPKPLWTASTLALWIHALDNYRPITCSCWEIRCLQCLNWSQRVIKGRSYHFWFWSTSLLDQFAKLQIIQSYRRNRHGCQIFRIAFATAVGHRGAPRPKQLLRRWGISSQMR